MKIKDIFRRWLPMRWQRIGDEDPLSMVLLLREAHFFKKEELQLAAARAWRTQFTGDSPKHCVVQSGSTTLVKAGPHLLSLFHFAEPYIEDHRENIEWLALESQRRAWIEHRACVGVDYMNKESDVELGYCVLAKLVAEMVDENCTAVYVPRESALIPNGQSLYNELQKMSVSRNPGVLPVN